MTDEKDKNAALSIFGADDAPSVHEQMDAMFPDEDAEQTVGSEEVHTRDIHVEMATESESLQHGDSVQIQDVSANTVGDRDIRLLIKSALGGSIAHIEPADYLSLEKNIDAHIRSLKDSAFGVSYLVESIARTIEHSSPSSENGNNPALAKKIEKIQKQRLQAADKLHRLAQGGGREALKESVRSLKILIHDIKAVRDRVKLLEETNASAHSALNQSEHRFDALQSLNEQLFVSMHTHLVEHGAGTRGQRLIDANETDAERFFIAENLCLHVGQSLQATAVPTDADAHTVEDTVEGTETHTAAEQAEDLLKTKLRLLEEELTEKNEALAAAHMQIEMQAQESSAHVKALRASDGDPQARVAELEAEIAQARIDFETERQYLLGAKTGIQQELDDIRDDLEQSRKELARMQAVSVATALDEITSAADQETADQELTAVTLAQSAGDTEDRIQQLEDENNELHVVLEEVRKQAAALNEELDVLKSDRDGLLEGAARAQGALEILEKQNDETAKTLITAAADKQAEEQTEKEAEKETKKEWQETISALQTTVTTLETQIQTIQESYSAEQERTQTLQATIAEHAAELNQAQRAYEDAQTTAVEQAQESAEERATERAEEAAAATEAAACLHTAELKAEQFEAAAAAATAAHGELTEQQAASASEKETLQASLDEALAANESAMSQAQAAAEKVTELEAELEASAAAQAQSIASVASAAQESEATTSALTTAENECQRLTQEHEQSVQEMDALRTQIADVETASASEKETLQTSLDEALAAALTANESAMSQAQAAAEKVTELEGELETSAAAQAQTIASVASAAQESEAITSALTTAENECQRLTQEHEQSVQEMDALRTQIADVEAASASEKETLQASLDEAASMHQQELEQQQQAQHEQQQRVEETCQNLEQTIDALKHETTEQEHARLADADTAKEQQQAASAALETQHAAQMSDKEQELDALHDQVHALEENITALTAAQERADEAEQTTRAAAAQATDEQQRARVADEAAAQQATDTLQNSLEAQTTTLHAQAHEIEQLHNELITQRTEYTQTQAAEQQQHTDLAERIDAAHKALNAQQQDAADAATDAVAEAAENAARYDAEIAAVRAELTAAQEQVAGQADGQTSMQAELASLRIQASDDQQRAQENENALHQQVQHIEKDRLHSDRQHEEALADIRSDYQAAQAQHVHDTAAYAQAVADSAEAQTQVTAIAESVHDICVQSAASFAASFPADVADESAATTLAALVDAQTDMQMVVGALKDTDDAAADVFAQQTQRLSELSTTMIAVHGSLLGMQTVFAEHAEQSQTLTQTLAHLRTQGATLQDAHDDTQAQLLASETEQADTQQMYEEVCTAQDNVTEQLQAAHSDIETLETRTQTLQQSCDDMRQEMTSTRSASDDTLTALQRTIAELTHSDEQQRSEIATQQQRSAILLQAWQDTAHEIDSVCSSAPAVAECIPEARAAATELSALVAELTAASLPADFPHNVALSAQRLLREMVQCVDAQHTEIISTQDTMAATQDTLQTLQTAHSEQAAALTLHAQQAHAHESARADREQRCETLQSEVEAQQQQMHALHQELSIQKSACTDGEQRHARTQKKLEQLTGVEKELSARTDAYARMEKQKLSHESSNQKLIVSINDVSLHTAEMYDQLGLMSPGASRRLSRTTQSFTKAQHIGVPMEVADYGSELLKRIMEQVTDMHNDARHTRSAHTELTSTCEQLHEQLDTQSVRAQTAEERTQQIEQSIAALETQATVLQSANDASTQRYSELDSAHSAAQATHAALLADMQDDMAASRAIHEEEQAQVQRQIEETRTQLETATRALESITQRYEELSSDFTAQGVEAETTRQSLQETIDDCDTRVQTYTRELDVLKAERLEQRGLEARINTLNEQAAESTRELVRIHKDAEQALGAQAELAGVQAQAQELQQERDARIRQIRTLERQHAEEKARTSALKKTHDKHLADAARTREQMRQDMETEVALGAALQAELRQCKRTLAGTKARRPQKE